MIIDGTNGATFPNGSNPQTFLKGQIMSNTITWQIEWMNSSNETINGFKEVLLTAGWRATGTDGTNTSTVYSTVSFPEPSQGSTFTPYVDLTQEEVLSWIWANGVDKETTEATLNSNLALLDNPPVSQKPLPWAVK